VAPLAVQILTTNLEGENQLEIEGGIAGGRVDGAEAKVLARVLWCCLTQDPVQDSKKSYERSQGRISLV
jgi:hypothetical protein